MVWFFFIFDRLAKFFFAKQIFQSRHHVETDPNILEHEPRFHYDRKSVNWNTTGGRITISGKQKYPYVFIVFIEAIFNYLKTTGINTRHENRDTS